MRRYLVMVEVEDAPHERTAQDLSVWIRGTLNVSVRVCELKEREEVIGEVVRIKDEGEP